MTPGPRRAPAVQRGATGTTASFRRNGGRVQGGS